MQEHCLCSTGHQYHAGLFKSNHFVFTIRARTASPAHQDHKDPEVSPDQGDQTVSQENAEAPEIQDDPVFQAPQDLLERKVRANADILIPSSTACGSTALNNSPIEIHVKMSNFKNPFLCSG